MDRSKIPGYSAKYYPNLQSLLLKFDNNADADIISAVNNILSLSVPVGVKDINFEGRFSSDSISNYLPGIRGLAGKISGSISFKSATLTEAEFNEIKMYLPGVDIKGKSVEIMCSSCDNAKNKFSLSGKFEKGTWCKC